MTLAPSSPGWTVGRQHGPLPTWWPLHAPSALVRRPVVTLPVDEADVGGTAIGVRLDPLRVRWRGERGVELDHSCVPFLHQEYHTPDDEEADSEALGPPRWVLRSPTPGPGTWDVEIGSEKLPRQLLTYSVNVPDLAPPGQDIPRFRLGTNMSTTASSRAFGAVLRYDRWLRRFAANGGGLIRLGLVNWNMGLFPESFAEHPRLALRLDRAWRIDWILERCRELDVAVVLCLFDWGDFREGRDWRYNPLNRDRGGPCARSEDAFRLPEARVWLDGVVDDALGRWSAYGCVVAWELFNEAELATGYRRAVHGRWMRQVITRIADSDPPSRPVLVSHGNPRLVLEQQSLGIPIVQVHNYGWPSRSPALNTVYWARHFRITDSTKPWILSELSFRSDRAPEGGGADETRQALWASHFAGWCGPAWPFYWEAIDKLDAWSIWSGLARFVDGVRWSPSGWVDARATVELQTRAPTTTRIKGPNGSDPPGEARSPALAQQTGKLVDEGSAPAEETVNGRSSDAGHLASLLKRWMRLGGHRRREASFYTKSLYIGWHLARYVARRHLYSGPIAMARWRRLEGSGHQVVAWLCADLRGIGLRRLGPSTLEISTPDHLTGRGIVRLWSPTSGEVTSTSEVEPEGGRLRIELPAFQTDLALDWRSSGMEKGERPGEGP
jgi:hypothetical protein